MSTKAENMLFGKGTNRRGGIEKGLFIYDKDLFMKNSLKFKSQFHNSEKLFSSLNEELFDYHVVALVGLILVYSRFPSRNHKIDPHSSIPTLSCFIISCRFH